MVRIRKKPLILLSLIYIYIPVFLFLMGFVKAYIGLPVMMILCYVAYRFIRYNNSWNNEEIKINKVFFFCGIVVLFVIGYFAGWGRWAKQSFDWYKHNAVLSDLIEYSWPVYYENGNEKSMLTYYIGQYLVPAVAGKIAGMFSDAKLMVTTVPEYTVFSGVGEGAATIADAMALNYITEIPISFRIAEIAEYFWNTAGLLLVWMNLMLLLKMESIKAHIVELFVLIFFSVPQSLVEILVYGIYGIDCLNKNYILTSDYEIILQYTGNFRSLMGAFAQIIVPWLVVLIFMNNRDNVKMYLFYMLPLMLFAPLPLLGLVPIAAGHALLRFIGSVKEKKTGALLKEVFSPENVLCLLSFGTIMVLYLYGNVFEPKPDLLVFRPMRYGSLFGIYLIFIVINVLLYAVFVIANKQADHLFYIALAELLLLPVFRMGYFNDINLRASVPALIIIMCCLIKCVVLGFKNAREKKVLLSTVFYILLIALLYNGVSYQIQRFGERVVEEDFTKSADLYTYGSMKYFADRSYENMSDDERKTLLLERYPEMDMTQAFTVDLIYNYYSYDIEDNIFYRYLARKGIDN